MIVIPVIGLANINSLDYYNERNELTKATGLITEIYEQLKRKFLAQKSYLFNPVAFSAIKFIHCRKQISYRK
jgi:Tfp pilus assembly major pilin PilA